MCSVTLDFHLEVFSALSLSVHSHIRTLDYKCM